MMKLIRRQCSKSTVYALSSGLGKCGVAVIRVTGPDTKNALKYVCGFKKLPEPRRAILRSLKDVNSRDIIDKGLVLWFPGPNSFTGEDSCEFQVHGSIAVINGILNSLNSISSFRIAEPGEFTKRAFFNGKLDLTEVEGLGDLLNAETEIQRKQAYLQSQGYLSKVYNEWNDQLFLHRAHIEAMIDFEESENLENQVIRVVCNVEKLKEKLKKHIEDGRKGEILRHGVKTVIVGKPNVGKSSFFNILCGRPAAIVTPISGTTRDIIEIKLDIFGYPVVLLDTAGLRYDSSDPIENEGIKRAVDQVNSADIVILMLIAEEYSALNKSHMTFEKYMKAHLRDLGLEKLSWEYEQKQKYIIPVINKIDLCPIENNNNNLLTLSCIKGDGVDRFIKHMHRVLKKIYGEPSKEHLCMNNARHREHLKDCLNEFNDFLRKSENGTDIVILAEHLRRASNHLSKLVGKTSTDQMLKVIFNEFCIGK